MFQVDLNLSMMLTKGSVKKVSRFHNIQRTGSFVVLAIHLQVDITGYYSYKVFTITRCLSKKLVLPALRLWNQLHDLVVCFYVPKWIIIIVVAFMSFLFFLFHTLYFY